MKYTLLKKYYYLPLILITTLLFTLILGNLNKQSYLEAQSKTSTPNKATVPCVDGYADKFPCDNVDFLSFTSITEMGGDETSKAANFWGWTDSQTNKEYIIMGFNDRTSFIDISDPENPALIGILPTQTISATKYRDIKVYKDYAFIISDVPSLHGMQGFDLTRLRSVTAPPVTFTADTHYNEFGDAHNLFINEDTGFAYVTRTTNPDLCAGSVYMVNIQNPLNPTFAGCYEDGGLASDSMCVAYHGPDTDYFGKELCVVASDDNILVADVTDKANPITLADVDYPDVTRAHNAWFTKDHRYFVTSDMNDEMILGLNTRIFIWDLIDVENPTLIDIYQGPTAASDHNVWVKDGYAYVGNFHAGVTILDLTDIANPNTTVTQAAFFDTYPDDDNSGHVGGVWAIYPFFKSGVLAVDDTETGLYLLRPHLSPPPVTIAVQIDGSDMGNTNTTYQFTAVLTPTTNTMILPVTYTWQASDYTGIIQSIGSTLSDTVSFRWTTPGLKIIKVTATDANGIKTSSVHHITLASGECVNGFAGAYPCKDVDFISFTSLAELGASENSKPVNFWGWTDSETNKEYLLMGFPDKTTFIDVTDPENPWLVGMLPNQTITNAIKYRDIKTYKNYAVIIADVPSRHGMQIFDLTQLGNVVSPPATFTATAYYNGFGDGHNLFVNEDTGFAYVYRTTTPELCSAAMLMVNLQDPLNPTFAGCYDEGGLASDGICVVYHGPDQNYQGQEICAIASDDNILVADVTNKSNPVTLANLAYSNIARAHNTWFTEDHRHFVSVDMNDEMEHGLNTRVFIWDSSDLDNITLKTTYTGPSPASDHNIWVQNQYAYIGNFHAGLRILDLGNVDNANITEAAFFDTYPADDNTGHTGGAWAAYTYFESGVIAVDDREAGLYLLQPHLQQNNISLTGPANGETNTTYQFMAAINPITGTGTVGTLGTLTTPITYTWQATDQTTVINPSSASYNTVLFTWNTAGLKEIKVTATDAKGTQVSDVHHIILSPSNYSVYLPLVLK